MSDLSIYLPGIMLAYSAFLLGMVSPGPNILAVIGTAMADGRRAGIALAFGIAFGSLIWALLTVAGLSALLAAYAEALIVIKIVGGFYLLWLAFKAFKSAAARHDLEVRTLAGGSRALSAYALRGLTVQMTNPKAALVWIAIVSLGLKEGAPIWVGGAIIIGTFAMSLVLHCLYAVTFSTPFMVTIYGKARRWIQAMLGAFFAFAGLKLLTSQR